MNNYRTINPLIIQLVRKYASSLYLKLRFKIEIEDLQQELLISVLKSLESFDPRKGYIIDFLNTCLFQKVNEIARYYSLDVRKVIFYTVPLSEVPLKDLPTENRMKNLLQKSDILGYFPLKLRGIVENLEYVSKMALKRICNRTEFRTINKILNKIINGDGGKNMKNISCIETLSIRELSKLSEMDLNDLSQKISETHAWIKQLVEKFEMALAAKYSEEAKKKLHESGTDFGTCKLKKNGFVISVSIPKKVQWDQDILKTLYDKSSPNDRDEVIKVTYSVDERKYAKFPQALRDFLSPARTTTYGKEKISICEAENVI